MTERNPYAISFGRIPTQYISRSYLIDNIITTLISIKGKISHSHSRREIF